MNLAKRLAFSVLTRLVPDLKTSLEARERDLRAANTIIRAQEVELAYAKQDALRRKEEMREAYDLMGSGPEMCAYIEGQPVNVHEVKEAKLKESLWELELALEDRGWQRQLAMASTEFSRYGIQQLILMSRLYFIRNPLIRRGVLVSSYYVLARGIEITSDDDATNEAIKDFMADPRNAKEWGHAGLLEKHNSFLTDGNMFFAFFSDPGTGAVVVRTIDPTEILDKITDPDDSSVDWFYRRNWSPVVFEPNSSQGYESTTRKDEWYPAKGYDPPAGPLRPNAIGGHKINWDVPVKHLKGGAIPKWKFGCPLVYAAINDARAYVDFLKDWCTIQRMLTRFSWDLEQPGGAQAIGTASTAFSTTLGNSGTSIEQNPPPTVGAAFVRSPGTKLTPMKTAGSIDSPEQARRVLLQVAAAFGLPETFFGDASTGSLATAQSLDRPTELKFLAEQELWRETIIDVFLYVLQNSVRAPKGKLREAFGDKKTRFIAAKEAPKKKAANGDISVIVKFPAILEHDIAQMVTAIVQAGTMGGFQPAGTIPLKELALALMAEVGIEDPEERFNEMYPDYDAKVGNGDGQPEQDAGTPDTPGGAPGAPGSKPTAAPHLPVPSFGAESARMLRVLSEALVKMEREGRLRRTA